LFIVTLIEVGHCHTISMRKRTAGLAELYRLRLFAISLPAILSIIQEMVDEIPVDQRGHVESLNNKFAHPLTRISSKFQNLQQLVEAVVDMSTLPDLRVNPQHDPALQDLDHERHGLDQRAQKIAQVRVLIFFIVLNTVTYFQYIL
jgi:hypothetical protein